MFYFFSLRGGCRINSVTEDQAGDRLACAKARRRRFGAPVICGSTEREGAPRGHGMSEGMSDMLGRVFESPPAPETVILADPASTPPWLRPDRPSIGSALMVI